jgi:hypothetical protein
MVLGAECQTAMGVLFWPIEDVLEENGFAINNIIS